MPLDKVRDKLHAQLLEGIEGVGHLPIKPYPYKTLQRSWEGSTHDLIYHALQVHKGFE